MGIFIGSGKINYPELFTDDERLSIDKSIYYFEQAFEAGSPDANRLLMMVYCDPELKYINYDKAEYYNKIAIKQKPMPILQETYVTEGMKMRLINSFIEAM